MLRAAHGPSITVANFGVSGTTAANLLGGNVFGQPWSQRMAESNAQIIIINFGINDSRAAANESVDAFRTNEMEIVRVAKAAGKVVFVETSNPVIDPLCAALPSYVAATREAALALDVSVIDHYANMLQIDWTSMLSDLVHPTPSAYEVKAKLEQSALTPTIKELLRE